MEVVRAARGLASDVFSKKINVKHLKTYNMTFIKLSKIFSSERT